MQLKSISKKSPQNNNAFKKRIPYSLLLDYHLASMILILLRMVLFAACFLCIGQFQNREPQSQTPVPPPPPSVEETPTPIPPPPTVPVYNPMVRQSIPLAVTGMDINPSLVCSVVCFSFVDTQSCKEAQPSSTPSSS